MKATIYHNLKSTSITIQEVINVFRRDVINFKYQIKLSVIQIESDFY